MNRRIFTIISAVALWMVAGPGMAQGIGFTNPGPDAATVVGEPGQRANDIFPVRFVAINGTNIPGDREVLWLEPGEYTLEVRILAHKPSGLTYRRPNLRDRGHNRIDVVLEAGKTYQIAARFDRENRDAPYTTVVHKVTESD